MRKSKQVLLPDEDARQPARAQHGPRTERICACSSLRGRSLGTAPDRSPEAAGSRVPRHPGARSGRACEHPAKRRLRLPGGCQIGGQPEDHPSVVATRWSASSYPSRSRPWRLCQEMTRGRGRSISSQKVTHPGARGLRARSGHASPGLRWHSGKPRSVGRGQAILRR